MGDLDGYLEGGISINSVPSNENTGCLLFCFCSIVPGTHLELHHGLQTFALGWLVCFLSIVVAEAWALVDKAQAFVQLAVKL